MKKSCVMPLIFFFFELFTSEDEEVLNYPIYNAFPRNEDCILAELSRIFHSKEIKATIFRMNPLKALGINGLHALF